MIFFYLLQEIKDDLEPSTRSQAIPGRSKVITSSKPLFLASGSFQHTVASLFLYLRLC